MCQHYILYNTFQNLAENTEVKFLLAILNKYLQEFYQNSAYSVLLEILKSLTSILMQAIL
ncbi:hypothetical protein BpHYR1_046161 [Brachionus plicatilis]|uniref:Uncharacterized protein n=1 Tax=Brachionus plicatilis TaxID=10195 RepID=A0A3M7RSI9_BRAPC|nr:hypothetical protein BpHYR1_046161 [Brachionus plicatilis]